ncbi:sulfotransferase [uncultured Paraglaciecola sp.]|uniref:sulfotransferase family protein n=1 Tax=uncultured Paraglaciecola sp. TaxID=1765024 RepID=UPI002594A483|nr:sulfotransferase [uncultured Paraglaciecola sp.]
MAKPDFLVIGAQKGGTTWLDKMFKSHPDVWTPPVKELQFFNELFMEKNFKWTKEHRKKHVERILKQELISDTVNWKNVDLLYLIARKGISHEWYQDIFDFAPAGSKKGEMTPEYSLISKENVQDIYKIYPDMKIILVLREPVSRAMSGIKMRLLQQGFNKESKQEDVDEFVTQCAADWDVIERGNYKRIIETWSEVFGSEKFLYLFSDNLSKNSEGSLRKLSNFLEINVELFSANPKKKVHVGKDYFVSEKPIQVVEKFQKNNYEYYKELKDKDCNIEKG